MSAPADTPAPDRDPAEDPGHAVQESEAADSSLSPPIVQARRAPRLTRPTQEELDSLPADRRLELMDLDRQERHRRFNTRILAAGVLATVGTLLVTALTLRSGQDQLNVAREGQVTDRYAKAVEQLGSDKREVRTAAVYALERIAKDSEPDRQAIRDLLAAFVRERDPASTVKEDALPREPAIDTAAALTVLARRPTDPKNTPNLDLHANRTPYTVFPDGADLRDADLGDANLHGADLGDADLGGADLSDANLSGATLGGANLRGADLRGADLRHTDLHSADLRDADLSYADLSYANLRGANLGGVDLRDADLSYANLRGANLDGAILGSTNLHGANLHSADLRRTRLTEEAVRKMTSAVDENTMFGD